MSAFDEQSPVGFRRRVTVCVSACRCQNQERRGRKGYLMMAPTVMPTRFVFHVCDEMAASQGCMSLQSLGSLELNILKTSWSCSEQGRRLTEAADTRRYLLSIVVAGSSIRSYVHNVR